MADGILYLIPVPLAESDFDKVIPAQHKSIVASISDFVVENAKTARQWLKWYGHPTALRELNIVELKDSDDYAALKAYLAPLRTGKNIGLMSEAGCPGVADPGANLVREAHRAGFRVVPLVGPSAILLALIASGLNGQRFAFHGYLPVDRGDRAHAIATLEQRSRRDHETQIFIETPYRNAALFQALLEHCGNQTSLCIAADITGAGEMIATRSIGEWRKHIPDLQKKPALFLLLAG